MWLIIHGIGFVLYSLLFLGYILCNHHHHRDLFILVFFSILIFRYWYWHNSRDYFALGGGFRTRLCASTSTTATSTTSSPKTCAWPTAPPDSKPAPTRTGWTSPITSCCRFDKDTFCRVNYTKCSTSILQLESILCDMYNYLLPMANIQKFTEKPNMLIHKNLQMIKCSSAPVPWLVQCFAFLSSRYTTATASRAIFLCECLRPNRVQSVPAISVRIPPAQPPP